MISRLLRQAAFAGTLAGLVGCLGPGQPWGWLEASVTANFDPPAGRLDEEERLKTNTNYAVAFQQIEVGFDAFTLVLTAAGAGSFDPSNPPPGYSLCHNGHCHSDAGELVDYEVIALEMVGGAGGARVSIGLENDPVGLTASPSDIGVVPCDPSPCVLPKGALAGLELNLASLSLKGTVYDGLTGPSSRIPEEGIDFDVTVPMARALTRQIEGSIGPGHPLELQLAVQFQLPSELFDDIDFSQAPPANEQVWQEVLNAALEDHDALSVIRIQE